MRPPAPLAFPPFRLDVADERLWRGHEVVELRGKAFAVLRHLVENAGRLVTKDELLAAVWPKTAVGDWVLSDSVCELRKALGDAPRAPRFVEYRSRPRFSIGFGVGHYGGPFHHGPFMSHGFGYHFYDDYYEGPRDYYPVNLPNYWSWKTGPVRMRLTYEQGTNNTFAHDLVLERRKVE
jgi:hypothetical protein